MKNISELASTRDRLARLEARLKSLESETDGDEELRGTTVESVRRTIDQFKEGIARFEAARPRAASGARSKGRDMNTQIELGRRFQKLHEAESGVFVIPNPWDGVSARMLASLGFKALATSSSASAAALGYRDGCICRADALAHVRLIASATDLPVSADFENGFGERPEDVADAIRAVADAGAVGCSIDDSPRGHAGGLYDFDLALRRIEAAVAAARALPFSFTLTARTEECISGGSNLEETIKRLRAFEAAGADALFAPGLRDLESVQKVCAAVSKPVNFMIGVKGASFSLAQLRDAGVRRVSLSTALFRSAMAGLHEAAREAAAGTFEFAERALDSKLIAGMLRGAPDA